MARAYVLAIEHNWQMRKLIRANLESLGLEVREAVTAEHGLQRLLEVRPDLIVLDLDLPGGTALNLLDVLELRFAGSLVPVVLLSAEPPSRETIEKRSVAGHLLKPFGVMSLLEQVHSLLDPPRTPG